MFSRCDKNVFAICQRRTNVRITRFASSWQANKRVSSFSTCFLFDGERNKLHCEFLSSKWCMMETKMSTAIQMFVYWLHCTRISLWARRRRRRQRQGGYVRPPAHQSPAGINTAMPPPAWHIDYKFPWQRKEVSAWCVLGCALVIICVCQLAMLVFASMLFSVSDFVSAMVMIYNYLYISLLQTSILCMLFSVFIHDAALPHVFGSHGQIGHANCFEKNCFLG